MSLVDVKGVNLIPGFIARSHAELYNLSTTMDADGELCGGVFEIPRTGNISKIGFRIGTVTVSDAIKVSLQTVNEDTGRNTGILIDADAYGVLASVTSNTTYWVSLQNSIAVTRDGTPVAFVVEFNNYVAGNLTVIGCIGNFHYTNFPYVFKYVGGVGGFEQHIPNFGLEYDDGIIEPIYGVFPAVSSSYISWDTNDNPDRRGLRFSVPYNCRASGIFFMGDLDGDANIEIYDNDGTTIIPNGTISIDKNLRGTTGTRLVGRIFVTPIELTKNTFYRAVIHPTTATNIMLYYLDVTDDGDSEAMNAIDGGVNWHYTTCHGSPTAEEDWTQTLTRRPMIGIIIDQLESADYPAINDVRNGIDYDNGGETGVLDLPAEADVEEGVKFDNETKTGTLDLPTNTDVRNGVNYNNATETGVLDLPAIADVEKDVQFDNATKTGTFVVPTEDEVEEDVTYGADGTEFTGTYAPFHDIKLEDVGVQLR